MKEIEIIFVNDGSTDNSGELIDECEKYFENVKCFHQENRGVSVARNRGIENATGEYLGFVDVDDLIDEDMYEILYSKAKQNRLDLLSMEKIGGAHEVTIFENKEDIIAIFLTEKLIMSACNKIFKRELYPKFHFPEGKRIHEDLMAVYNALLCSERIGSINIDKYHYVQRENSSSREKVFSEKYFDAITIADQVYNDTITKYPQLVDIAETRKARTYLRISKIYYLRGAPIDCRGKIELMREYLSSLRPEKASVYFERNDRIRYWLYLHSMPFFLFMIRTIDCR